MEFKVVANNFVINYETGHTREEYMERFADEYDSGECWDILAVELEDGTLEPDEDILYWLIDDRYYETPLRVGF